MNGESCVGHFEKVNLRRFTGRKWTSVGKTFPVNAKVLR